MEAQAHHPSSWGEVPGGSMVLQEIVARAGTTAPVPVSVEHGEVLIFLGHVMHAWAGWGSYEEHANVRLHTYFLPASMPFPTE
eukprot:2645032-Rhodomonas_salina.1